VIVAAVVKAVATIRTVLRFIGHSPVSRTARSQRGFLTL
jgi:hypothetical protein